MRTTIGTPEDLHASATKAVGLDNFGDDSDNYREGLEVLCQSVNTEAKLTETGSKAIRGFVRSALAARALSEAAWNANPGYENTPITRPIFLTGLPRTGTTALHRLLHADSRNQGLELWLAEVPQPRPPRDKWEENPIYTALRDGYKAYMEANPDYAGLHYITADDIEECWQLFRQSMMSLSHESLYHVPSYSQWLSTQSWSATMARYKKNLQLIGMNDPEKTWVLKNPSHMFCIDEIIEQFPDAVIVQTHREPQKVIGSICSLAAHTNHEWSEYYRGDVLGQSQLELWSRGLKEMKQSREKATGVTFVDIQYSDLVSSPVECVNTIYSAAGIEMTDTARAEIEENHRESLTGPRKPSHSYSLADYGLTESMVDEAFDL